MMVFRYKLIIVNNFLIRKFFPFCSLFLLVACCKKVNPYEEMQDAALRLSEHAPTHFKQYPATVFHPSAYFSCEGRKKSCSQLSNIGKLQSHRTKNEFNHSHLRK